MKNKPVDCFYLSFGLFCYLSDTFRDLFHCKSKDFLPVHLNIFSFRIILFPWILYFPSRAGKYFTAHAVRPLNKPFHSMICRRYHRRSGTIPEQDTGGTVVPVDQFRQHFHAHQQDIFINPGTDIRMCGMQGK